MASLKHHIHIIAVYDQQLACLSQLMLHLQDRAFSTQDLPVMNSDTIKYSRHCIEACDAVVMLVADDYGTPNATGVSQMHLSYLNAKTKKKPICIFIKSPSSKLRSKYLLDFIRMVEQRGFQQLFYFSDVADFAAVLQQNMPQFIDGLPSVAAVLSAKSEKASHPLADQGKQLLADDSSNNTQRLSWLNERQQAFNTTTANAAMCLNLPLNNKHMAQTTKLRYTAHAYQGGNLQEVNLSASLTWQTIIEAIKDLGSPFSTSAIHRKLNEIVAADAPHLVASILPKAHAVSRCLVVEADLYRVLEHMRSQGWIRQTVQSRSSKSFWQLTIM